MSSLLIIDDDAPSSAALASLLRREGHEAACVHTAGAAITHLRHQEPDLVLLDLSMPGVDGLDLLDALTDDPQFARVRVAVYSGRDEPDSRAMAQRLGARDYILKGQAWPDTYQRIQSCLCDRAAGAPMA